MARQILLLRGINLAGRRTVQMARLREVLEQAGHRDVRTLLQSGNVVLTGAADPEALERELSGAFGFEIGVVSRTRDELAAVIAADPFGDEVTDPRLYQVSFLSAEPAADRVRELEAANVAPERVAVRGREIYAWHPNGIGRSRLAALISAQRLGVQVTARNWRTLTRLLELADEPPPPNPA